MLSDEIPHHEIDPVLARAVEAAKRLEDDRARYRAALERIAGQESGGWGRIAHEALRENA